MRKKSGLTPIVFRTLRERDAGNGGCPTGPEALTGANAPGSLPDRSAAPLTQWPKHLRPREKLAANGPGALSDAELLALLLRTGTRGATAVDLAQRLLNGSGSIRALLDASPDALRDAAGPGGGIGPAKIAQLRCVAELAQRSLHERLREPFALDSPAAVRNFLQLKIGMRSREVFVCLYLDVRNRLIEAEETSVGTLTHTTVYMREIARRALQHNAAALIVAHNHPSGVITPSAADRRLTQTLRDALELFDIRLLDHLVVSTNAAFSFAEHAWL
jgi:DNA repair protein RadC